MDWKETLVTKMHDNPPYESQWRYKIWLPEFLATWDIFAGWEQQRFISMEENIKNGDILFDIGTEIGWQNIIYAKFCGPENIVLIEPNSEFWPNIHSIWKKNFIPNPLACYEGLISNKTTSKKVLKKNEWPKAIKGKGLNQDIRGYEYIHSHKEGLKEIRLDEYIKETNINPTALTIDVEGAELLVLQGAEKTLKANNLKVWVSIHPELGERDYQVTPQMLHDFMESCGYKGKLLEKDHEVHWFFTKG